MSDKAQDVRERCSVSRRNRSRKEEKQKRKKPYTFLRNSEKQTGSKLCYMVEAL